MKIKFATDGVADLPKSLLEKYDIAVVPSFVNYGGRSMADDGVELSREKFYQDLPNLTVHATTAAPPPAIAEEVLKRHLEGADHLIAIVTPPKLAANYNSFRLGGASLPEGRFTLIDSRRVAMAMGWQVVIGAEVAARTGSLEATLDAISRVQRNQVLYCALPTLEYLRRSGRVGWASASIGSLLQIKPILQVDDDDIRLAARVRTYHKAVDYVIDMLRQQGPLEKLAVIHANHCDGAREIMERVRDIAPDDAIIADIGPTLGVHVGPGALGFASVSASWRV